MRILSAVLMAQTAILLKEADAVAMRSHVDLLTAQVEEADGDEERDALAANIETLEAVAERLEEAGGIDDTENVDAAGEPLPEGGEADEATRHAPAGSPKGGQFISGGTTGAASTGGVVGKTGKVKLARAAKAGGPVAPPTGKNWMMGQSGLKVTGTRVSVGKIATGDHVALVGTYHGTRVVGKVMDIGLNQMRVRSELTNKDVKITRNHIMSAFKNPKFVVEAALVESGISGDQLMDMTEAEAAALFEEKMSFDEIASKLRAAAAEAWTEYSAYPNAVYTDEVIFSCYKRIKGGDGMSEGKNVMLKCDYEIDKDGNVKLGEPTEVKSRTVYEPVSSKESDAGEVDEAGVKCPECGSENVKAVKEADEAEVAEAKPVKMACVDCGKEFTAKSKGFVPFKKKDAKESNAEFLDGDSAHAQEIIEAAADGLILLIESSSIDISEAFEVVEGKRVLRGDGSVRLKLIQPGWGSSGHYPADMLEKCGPKVFKKGLKMYWDHPTEADDKARPERSLRDLSAVLMEDAKWDAKGKAGPGLYADAKVFKNYREYVEELAPHIGVSIRAMGRAKEGKAEGREGPIIEELAHAKSVDFVTTPGAGGQIMQLFEAAREHRPLAEAASGMDLTELTSQSAAGATPVITESSQEEEPMNEAQTKELTDLREADRANKAVQESQAQTIAMLQAERMVESMLVGAHLPEAASKRVRESLLGTEEAPAVLPLTDAKLLDRAKLKESAEARLTGEAEYLESVGAIGTGSARIIGMGASVDIDEAADYSSGEKFEEAQVELEEALTVITGKAGIAKEAAKGRTR